MKITREIDGKKIEIELTDAEVWEIYRKVLEDNMRDDILNVCEWNEIRELTEEEMADVLEYYMDHAGEGAYEDIIMNALDYCGIEEEG